MGIRGTHKEQYPLEVAAEEMEFWRACLRGLERRLWWAETMDAGPPAEASLGSSSCGVSQPHHPFYVPYTECP